MDWRVTLIVLFLASCFPSSDSLRLFHYVNLNLNWASAQQYCRSKYTDLATIKSMEDISRLNRSTLGTTAAWIGLNDDPNSWMGVMSNDPNSWRWSLTGQTNPNGYQAWSSYEPNDKYLEYCGMMYSNGLWNDCTCGSLSGFICYTETQDKQKTYVFISLQLTWTDAQTYCRQNFIDLPMIENSVDNTNVCNVIPYGAGAWIGLYRLAWKWSDKSNSLFKNWVPGKPDNYMTSQYCVTENNLHQWDDDNCEYQMAFLCHEDLLESMTLVKIQIQTCADMTDPATSTQFFQKLGLVLRSHGVSYNNLRWKILPDKRRKKLAEPVCETHL